MGNKIDANFLFFFNLFIIKLREFFEKIKSGYKNHIYLEKKKKVAMNKDWSIDKNIYLLLPK